MGFTVLLSEQIRAARVLLGWGQAELAMHSGIGIATLKRLEASRGMIGGTIATGMQVKAALETAGIEFLGGPGEGPGVRLWKTAKSKK